MSLLSQAFRAQVKQTKDYSQKNEMTYFIMRIEYLCNFRYKTIWIILMIMKL